MAKKTKLGSVLMPVYDGDDPGQLALALESVLSQTYENLEVLLILDGVAREDILAVVRDFEKRDSRMRILEKPVQSGIVDALNLALENARGEYLIRQDADDISLPDRVEKQISFLEARPELSFCSTFQDLVTEDGEVVGEYVMPLTWEQAVAVMPWKVPFGHANAVFRKEFFETLGPYRDFLKNQDTDLWFRAYYAGLKGENLPDRLYQVRRSSNWAGRKKTLKIALADFSIRRHYIKKGGFPFHARLAPYLYFTLKMIPGGIFHRLYIPLHAVFVMLFRNAYEPPRDGED